jgi:ABC-type transport system involved in cytochrome c biogenesis ATPase subunit
MRIVSIDANNIPPVNRFHVDELSEVVVIAGPNGIGKTRLIR